jgi:hypothetical protein
MRCHHCCHVLPSSSLHVAVVVVVARCHHRCRASPLSLLCVAIVIVTCRHCHRHASPLSLSHVTIVIVTHRHRHCHRVLCLSHVVVVIFAIVSSPLCRRCCCIIIVRAGVGIHPVSRSWQCHCGPTPDEVARGVSWQATGARWCPLHAGDMDKDLRKRKEKRYC